jgi:hypothetical protein
MIRTPSQIMAVLITVALAVGCAGNPDESPAAPAPTTSARPSAPATSATPGPSGDTTKPSPGTPSTGGPTWSSGPITVAHSPAVPPVPVITGIRYAAHSQAGYDRIVFDVQGALPGYSVRYVDQVGADPSDRVVTVPGRRHLLIVMRPAQAHRDNGTATVSGTHRVNLPMLKSYAVVGDFEGVVSIALSLDDVVGYRVGELPGRIYLDVAA